MYVNVLIYNGKSRVVSVTVVFVRECVELLIYNGKSRVVSVTVVCVYVNVLSC